MKNRKSKKSVRLPAHVKPIKYEIQLKPDLENFTFEGLETIYLSLGKPSSSLTLHSREIDIETADATLDGEKVFAKISYDEKNETATFTFPKKIPAGRCELKLVFSGILNDKMRGFYRSRYNIGSVEYNIATTQFEATDARRAFPCFDEPAHKAVFNVSLVVPKGKTAISNTLPVSRLEHEAGYEVVKFSPTPKMSTYLVAFIVGDFEHIQAETKRGVLVRVFTVPGKKHQAQFALSCAVKTLEFYEAYFGIPYPLPALDMIAIPDFSSAAMENWGAVTYRESALLVDEEHSSVGNRQWVASVITHELAHQWFGNLVTMEWWTHLWLNEGFATYIGNFAQDKLYPRDDVWNQFVAAVSGHGLGSALRLDALRSTHPVEVLVHHPDEISEVFDIISYDKGASVIRMIADYLGPVDFREGLRYYLKKHSYKNTATVHLWQAFEKVSGKPVTRIMYDWIAKPGYPVISVRRRGGKLSLDQTRFFSSIISKKKTKDATIWQIPVAFGDNKMKKEILLSKNISELRWNRPWVKLNLGEASVFRTAYSGELLEALRKPVEKKLLPPGDRLGIIRDLFALAEAGVVPATAALGFLSAYKNETEYTVWVEIAGGIGTVRQLIAKEKYSAGLDRLVLDLFSPLYEKLGWNKKKGEGSSTALLRSLMLSALGRAGHRKVIAEARQKFAAILAGKKVDADLHGAVYGIIAANGGEKEYQKFLRLYRRETLHEEKNRIGDSLGGFRNKKILRDVCRFAMSQDVRPQDAYFIFSYVGRNPLGRDIWLDFIKKNWKTLVSRYGEGGMALSGIVKAISASPEPGHLSEYKKFFASHDAPGAARAIEQTIERLESNVAWLKRDGKAIAEFLKK